MPRAIRCSPSPTPSYHGLVYTEHYGAAAFIGRCRSVYQRTMGAVLSPMNAFLLLQGIETVALRIERHVENARRVAEFLRADPRVESVNYAGFPDNPYHALVQKYLGGRACSLLTFDIRGGVDGGHALLRCAQALQAARQPRATRNPSPAIRPRPRIDRCRPRSSWRRASDRAASA